jgi:hypothetical protein
MEGWIDELAAELGEDPLTREEVVRLLEAARDVARALPAGTMAPEVDALLGDAEHLGAS